MTTIKAKAAAALPVTGRDARHLYDHLGATGYAVVKYLVEQRTESSDHQEETVRIRITGVFLDDTAAGDLYRRLLDTDLNTGALITVDADTGEISARRGADADTAPGAA